ncbi:MAG: FmdB family zinc ribbon protein [Streptosporangiaceae bacterium]
MPTYQYACTECGDRSEVVQRFTDDPLTVCAACGGKLRKIFSPVGIVFKGSGFYRTDSRNGPSTVPAGKDGAANGSSSENGSSGGSDSASGGASKDGAAAKDSGGSKTTSSAPAADKKSGPVSTATAS